MKVSKDVEKYWDEVAKGLLLNKKIVNVRYLTKKQEIPWVRSKRPFMLRFGTL